MKKKKRKLKTRKKLEPIPQGKKRSLKKLLVDIDDSITFLSNHFHILGYSRDDLKQMMIINIIKTYKKNPKYYNRRKLGYWFKLSKWHMLNLLKKNERNPLANSISIDSIENNCSYTTND